MSLSVFKPVNRIYYEQVDGFTKAPTTPKVIVKSPEVTEHQPTNRRYRQSELVQQIASLEAEMNEVKELEHNGHISNAIYTSRMKYLEAILKQKQKHLLRLQKNVVIQKSIRIKRKESKV